MPKPKDITGQKFNKLTAVEFVDKNKFNKSKWLFKCDCGKEIIREIFSISQRANKGKELCCPDCRRAKRKSLTL